jgi:hypothetical protein
VVFWQTGSFLVSWPAFKFLADVGFYEVEHVANLIKLSQIS